MDKEQRRQDWENRIADFRSSGLTMKAWCSENGFALDHLKYWLYKGKRSASAASSLEWMPVSLSEPLNAPPSGHLQIHIGPARIEIGPGFEPQLLREVIKVLSASC